MIPNFSILCALVPLAFAEEAPRIVGGSNANIEDFPYQVSLQTIRDGEMQHFCGGSILTEEWILTAGHCIAGLDEEMLDKLVVVVGSTKLSEATEKGQIIAYGGEKHVHKYYKDKVLTNDIAVIKIAPGLEFNDKAQPVKLPEKGFEVSGKVLLSGWGSTGRIFENMPDNLQRATFQIISLLECRAAFWLGGAPVNAKSNICTKKVGFLPLPTSGGCNGDSGGPLTQNGIQVGIVSWGDPICGSAPTVYTKVSNYIDFINKYVSGVNNTVAI